MREADLDALLLFQPEAFRYATGLDPGVAKMRRQDCTSIALVPSDAAEVAGAIIADHALHFGTAPHHAVELITHPLWIDYVDYTAQVDADPVAGIAAAYRAQALGGARPERYDRDRVFALLSELLSARNLSRARIGIDLEFLSAIDFIALQAMLPKAVLCDGTQILRRLQSVKAPFEIDRLRWANQASKAGLKYMAAHMLSGNTRCDLEGLWRKGAQEIARTGGFKITGDLVEVQVGADMTNPNPILGPGDIVTTNMGVAVEGYLSCSGRSYTLGPAPPYARILFAVIQEAFLAGLEVIRPGAAFADVHSAVLAATRGCGLPDYYSGHFGHSVGATGMAEEWPFISASNTEEILPGMVLAFEVAFFIHGTGALMLNEQLLITETGIEIMGGLPRALDEIPLAP